MRRSLSELLCDDLAELANHESDYIASEEAIQFMSALYNSKRGLNIQIIHKDQLLDLLKNNTLLTNPGHYQFLVEVGERSKLKQRSPDIIHYCAVDLFVRPGKTPLAFVGDHYRGYNGYYFEFARVAQTLGIQFIVVGGATYQADNAHCPIFSLQHLLLTAEDDTILPLLDEKINDLTDEVIYLNWNELSPMYMVYSQSVNTLFNYVRDVKKKEGTNEDLDSTLLADSQFAKHLQSTLYPVVQQGINQGKIRNKAIKYQAAHHAGIAVTELEAASTFDTAALINICYKERYPLVREVLLAALEIEEKYPFETNSGIDNAHPLFELAFYHAHIMENFLKHNEFRTIFTDKNLLILMQKGLINPTALFNALTETGHHLELKKSACSSVTANLMFLATIVQNDLDEQLDIAPNKLIELLTAGKTKNFFQNKTLSALFEKGLISIDLLQRISPNQVNVAFIETLEQDEAIVNYLDQQFTPTVQVDDFDLFEFEEEQQEEVADNTGLLYDLFGVPEVQPATLDPSIAQKPQVNVGLLVQSMSKSIFTTPPVEDKSNENTLDVKEKIAVSY